MLSEEIFVPLDSVFDCGKVVVDQPETHTFTKGGSTGEWTISRVYVLGNNGEKPQIYFEIAEQNLWGVNCIWPV